MRAKIVIMRLRKYSFSYIIAKLRLIINSNDTAYMERHLNQYFSHLNKEESIIEMKKWFEKKTGEKLEIECPKTYNQKIQWLKIFDSTKIKSRLSDKIEVREWVSEKLGSEHLTTIYGKWNNFDDIDFKILPDAFVLKANHGSNMNIVVKQKQNLDLSTARRQAKSWLIRNYGANAQMELQYREIKPMLYAEKYMENEDGDLYDYKIHCFHGKPEYIQMIKGRNRNETMAFYDTQWKRTNIHRKGIKKLDNEPKPEKLIEMLRIAEKLSAGFVYVRVDLYCVKNRVYFGEMTFTPSAGIGLWEDEESNVLLGKMIDLKKVTKTEFWTT